MTDLRDQLAALLDGEPDAPYDLGEVVRVGRRHRRRRSAALVAAGTVGAAGLSAAVVVPVVTLGGDNGSVTLGSPPPPPSPSASTSHGRCYIAAVPPRAAKRTVHRLIESGKVGAHPSVIRLKKGTHPRRLLLEVCSPGMSPTDPRQPDAQDAPSPAGPPYDYTEKPAAIATRLGAHLHERVSGFGLSVSYTRPFSQESSTLDDGRPTYYGGNVDVHENDGYADIGVQVTHEVTRLVPFTGDCAAAEHCVETTLPDGSVMRTGHVAAGRGDVILTAEVHRPDGVVVQAQESNYPFGPDAGSQPHGDMPLTLDQLTALAQDDAFTF